VKDDRIISTGYNGVPKSCDHCDEHFKNMSSEEVLREHKKWAIENEPHAERNAISYAAKNGVSTKDTIMFSLYSPCVDCAKKILACGIKKVYYKHFYHNGEAGKKLLVQNNVIVRAC